MSELAGDFFCELNQKAIDVNIHQAVSLKVRIIFMDYGKYPFEPYGYQGGLLGNQRNSTASVIGTLVGLAVRVLFLSVFKIGFGLAKLLTKGISNAWSGIAAGFATGLKS